MVTLADISLSNWLEAPYNRLAVRHVADILPVDTIKAAGTSAAELTTDPMDPSDLRFRSADGELWGVEPFLERTNADGLLILRDGKIAYEWYVDGQKPDDPHLIFSVTKSVVGAMIGVLVERCQIDPAQLITAYLPEVAGTGFEGATVRQILDMTASVGFAEAYLDPESDFARYRRSTGWFAGRPGSGEGGMHDFLMTMPEGTEAHGQVFSYLSPFSDLLGWVCERVTGERLAKLISEIVWEPMGARHDATITVDAKGAPRAAGGISCTLRDMARFGECMRLGGRAGDRQVIPEAWVNDIRFSADRDAWKRSSMNDWIPGAGYRGQWWITYNAQGGYMASGIYGQWLYIAPELGVVVAKQASRWVGPADQATFELELTALVEFAAAASRRGQAAQV
jgi:CubicO group peptidase (beta-lactamase class C family)